MKPVSTRMRGLAAAAVFALAAGGAAAEAPSGVYRYTVHNERFGEVGVYTNSVRRAGASTIVENRTEIAVKVLFMTVFRLSAASTQVWRGGRLVRFDARTDDDGRVFEVKARADKDRFEIESTVGKFVAATGVYPHNPWSMGIVAAPEIMSPKSGELFAARIDGGRAEDIEVGGRTVKTVAYRIDTDRRTWVWYDRRGIPVKFAMERKRGRELLTFTLDRGG